MLMRDSFSPSIKAIGGKAIGRGDLPLVFANPFAPNKSKLPDREIKVAVHLVSVALSVLVLSRGALRRSWSLRVVHAYMHTYIHAYMHTFMFLTHTFTALEVIQGPAANSVNQSPSITASLGLTNEVMAVATMGRGIQAIVARCRCMQVQYAQGHATVSTPTDHIIMARTHCATKKRILKLSHDCCYTQTYIQSTRSQSTNNNAITRGHRDGAGMHAQLDWIVCA